MQTKTLTALGVTDKIQAKLEKLHIHHIWDAVLHLPLRYEDETHLTMIADAQRAVVVQVEGEILGQELQFKPRRQLVVRLQDDAGTTLNLRFLHFYPSQQQQLAPGKRIRALGEIKAGFYGDEMIHPKIHAADNRALAETLTPIYPTVSGLSQPTLRRIIHSALQQADLSDTLPDEVRTALHLPDFASSVRLLHQPPPNYSISQLHDGGLPAWQRLKFDELLAQQLSMKLAYAQRRQGTATPLQGDGRLATQLVASLPFALTLAQQRVWTEIGHDMAQPYPMHRLLQGDVGSGKTIVAALAAVNALEAGAQVAVMAPTEILAEQHYHKFTQWLKPLGIEVIWLTGSSRKKIKMATKTALADGSIRLVVGTHALFQDDVVFAQLGLVIVDEQHRFGVGQRLALKNKGHSVHQLMMSATPIPRTLAMSFFADLDVSVIDELPPNRSPIKTKLINAQRRDEVEAFVRHTISQGQQVYWVCPLIEESETLQLQTAVHTQQILQDAFADYSVGLVHGRLKSADKAAQMQQFIECKHQILVATTVIEVGVDVPNASLMVIEHAERMGLAQLHQLRGRVGRGQAASSCILMFTEPLSDLAKARLKVIYEHQDGFEIARQDLNIRGPGEFLGAKQSGIPMLRFANLEEDLPLLEQARDVAQSLIDHQHDKVVQRHLARWLSSRAAYLGV